jgi:glycosyltransferase involved in cell wall biosynthesis
MPEIATTVPPDLEALGAFPHHRRVRVHVINRHGRTRAGLVRVLLREATRRDALLLNGSGRVDQIAAAVVRRSFPRAKIVISDATWDPGVNVFDRMACRLGIRALDGPNVTYCVLSRAEMTAFPEQWRVDADRVRYTPFCHTLRPQELSAPLQEGEAVFAGGDSMRDYAPLLEAARDVGCPLHLAVRRPASLGPLPANVTAQRVTHERFLSLMREASVVVVPLRAGIRRSAGQQTFLNAMALGKVVIVTDGPGARDYVSDRVDGLLVPPDDAGAIASALRWAQDPANADDVRELRSRAVHTARERFSPERHFVALLDVVADVLAVAPFAEESVA